MANLGHNNDFVPRQVELLDRLAEDDFGEPVRVHLKKVKVRKSISLSPVPKQRTYIRGVERLDSLVICVLDMLDGFLLSQDPFLPFWAAVGHAAQDDLRHLEPGVSETHWSKRDPRE